MRQTKSRVTALRQGFAYTLRTSFARSIFFRSLRYGWKYPGLAIDPSANVVVKGSLKYGERSSVAEGCNLLVPAGATFALGSRCYLGRYVEVGPSGNISIGDNTSIQDRGILVGDVHLGRRCVVSLNVLMTSGRHYFNRWPHLLIHDQDARVASDPMLARKHSQPIRIEEDCWLGMNSVIMPGVVIGRGSVIGANAVVTRDIPPYSVAVGAPAQIVRRRLDFAPPELLEFNNVEHIPYFYRGFELSDKERSVNEALGGHVARGDFAVWLSKRDEMMAFIRLRSLSGPVVLTYKDQKFVIGDKWQDLQIPLTKDVAEMMFALEGSGVAVSKAWLQ